MAAKKTHGIPQDLPSSGGEISKNLKNLEAIVGWFSSQTEVDVEQGLERVKQGAELIKTLKKQLAEVENEFEVIKKDIDG